MKERESLVKRVPKLLDVLDAFYKTKDLKQKVYVPVIADGISNHNVKVYFEKFDEAYLGLCRVFFTISEVEAYLMMIAEMKKYNRSSLKSLEISIERLVEEANSLAKKTEKPIRLEISTFYDEEIINIMTIWDSRPN